MPIAIGVKCLRCDVNVQCSATMTPEPPKPGQKTAGFTTTVTDLAERMAEHYRQAHPDPIAARNA